MSFRSLLRKMRKSRFFVTGLVGVILIVGISVLSPMMVVHDAELSDLTRRLLKPEWLSKGWQGFTMGTDPLGRDVLTRVLIGSRASLFIALSVVTVTLVIGTAMGLVAGYYGGITDTVIMRLCDIILATPALMLAICIVAALGCNFFNLIIVLIITSWVSYARLVRGNVLSIRNAEYVQASRVLGAGNLRIMLTQILPNVLTSMIIMASQQFGTIILIEAGMSFLGVGVPLPTPSWGRMIAEGREYIAVAPWVVVAPGLALMLTVLSFNFLGDGLRDVLDPKNKD